MTLNVGCTMAQCLLPAPQSGGPGSILPIPVAELSRARVYGQSLAGMSSLNPAGGMDVCVVCCTVRTKEQAITIREKKHVRKRYTERTREELHERKKVLRQSMLDLW